MLRILLGPDGRPERLKGGEAVAPREPLPVHIDMLKGGNGTGHREFPGQAAHLGGGGAEEGLRPLLPPAARRGGCELLEHLRKRFEWLLFNPLRRQVDRRQRLPPRGIPIGIDRRCQGP